MIRKIIPIAIFSAILVSACTIPFLYESSSIFYKFGIEKNLLRMAKIIGITGGILLMMQPVLSGRFRFLVNTYGNKALLNLHKKSGYLILMISLIHPFAVLSSNDFVLFSFEKEYIPEFVGIAMTLFIIPFVTVSIHKKRFGLSYGIWKNFHFAGAQIIFVLLFYHIFFVSSSFESDLPFKALLFLLMVVIFLSVRKFFRSSK